MTDASSLLQKLWDRYVELRAVADRSSNIEDGKAAARARAAYGSIIEIWNRRAEVLALIDRTIEAESKP